MVLCQSPVEPEMSATAPLCLPCPFLNLCYLSWTLTYCTARLEDALPQQMTERRTGSRMALPFFSSLGEHPREEEDGCLHPLPEALLTGNGTEVLSHTPKLATQLCLTSSRVLPPEHALPTVGWGKLPVSCGQHILLCMHPPQLARQENLTRYRGDLHTQSREQVGGLAHTLAVAPVAGVWAT